MAVRIRRDCHPIGTAATPIPAVSATTAGAARGEREFFMSALLAFDLHGALNDRQARRGVGFWPRGAVTMAQVRRLGFNRDDEQEEADRQSVSLAGLAVTLALVVVGVYVIHQLEAKDAIEDCLLADHANCDILLSSSSR